MALEEDRTMLTSAPQNSGAPARGVSEIRKVSILGSTGSVGQNTVELLLANRDRYAVQALVANNNAATLATQAMALGVRLAVVADKAAYPELKEALSGSGIEAAAGPEAVIAAATMPADWIMAAIVGAAGLRPTLAALEQGTILALANKECLVCAGTAFMARAAKSGTTLLPVDSEHSAIFQSLDNPARGGLETITLTASGGPFRTWSLDKIADAGLEDALNHPNWDMGAKVTIDSATMMNKGLELIEAHHLFGLGNDRIDILVHPESIIHGMATYADGSVIAQLGVPDMRTPIAVSLAWPNRMAAPVAKLDLAKISSLTFEAPDLEKFPAIGLARNALCEGDQAATVLNAANEIAVSAFLDKKIGFLDIAALVEDRLARTNFARTGETGSDIESLLVLDRETRHLTGQEIRAKAF
jgi:1-deoxy-D-xylulose-5-phosphate reductoisomerase